MKYIRLVMGAMILLQVSGCATIPRNAVPENLTGKAVVGDMTEIRTIMGIPNPASQRDILEALKIDDHSQFPTGADGIKTYPVLVISGGGANGAYGAGLLKGWSKEGSRPVFKAVTGVSTGALTAPLAFLGKDYDADLEKYYTTLTTKDITTSRSPLSVLSGDSLADTEPLAKIIAKIVTPEMLDKIALEHKRGRRLFVGTVNLDTERFVMWNMGAIAVRGDVELFRKIVRASAAIPVIFPPVHIAVTAGSANYEEMHVDGGTMTQMFALAGLIDGMDEAIKEAGLDKSKFKAKYYFIRNGHVSGNYKKTENKLADIANRAFETMINSQGVGDIYRIYQIMKQKGNDFNLAFIPGDFRPEAKEMFDPVQMRQLFDRGYQDAVGGYPWHKSPPGLDEFSGEKHKMASQKENNP